MKLLKSTLLIIGILFTSSVLADKKADVTINISGNDTMKFDKTTLDVTEGQVVKIVFKNAGTLPKAAMGHNLVVLKPGTDLAKFAGAAISAKDQEYIPQDEENKSKIIAHTKVLGPGEEEAIYFTAGAPGAYPFICSFPGHYAIMQGIIKVKAK